MTKRYSLTNPKFDKCPGRLPQIAESGQLRYKGGERFIMAKAG